MGWAPKRCANPDKNGGCEGVGTKYKGLAGVDSSGVREHMWLCPTCNKSRDQRLKLDRAATMVAKAFSSENPENATTKPSRNGSFQAGHQKNVEPEYYQPSLFD